jgi:hypothetical protein
MTSPAEQSAVLTGSAIGRYFAVVSSLPSLLFVSYVYILIRSHAWTGPVDFSMVFTGDWWKSAIYIGLASFAAALALHPLQFTLIRLLEGYWGTSEIGRQFAVVRLRHHRRRYVDLVTAITSAGEEVERATLRSQGPDTRDASVQTLLAAVWEAEARRERANYPDGLDKLLPTRLGNILRAQELRAGRAYGLDSIKAFPRVALIAPAAQLEYAQDQRLQLELAVRTTVLGLLAACVTVLFMWWHGTWVLLALVPYSLAYLSYRGAVVLAASYGSAVAHVLELNKLRLYELMGLARPTDTVEERRQNEDLMVAFDHDPETSIQYTDPGSTSHVGEATS